MSHRKQTIIKAVAHLAAYACMFMFVLSPLGKPSKKKKKCKILLFKKLCLKCILGYSEPFW